MTTATYTPLISSEFATAIVKAQGEIEGAKKGSSNPHLKSKYADLAACWDACREALHTNGIGVLQFPTKASSPGHVAICTLLVFAKTGEILTEVPCEVPIKDATNAQAFGSSVTYGRRYSLCSVIGICPEDDDGHAASKEHKAPKAKPEPSAQDEAAQYGWIKNWVTSKTLTERKLVYKNLKASDLSEPFKTSLLSKWAEQITKELKEETESNG